MPAFVDFKGLIDRYEINYGVIDTGYRTQEIYEEIYLERHFWFGAKGWAKMPTPYRLTKIDPYSVFKNQTRRGGSKINLLHVNKDVWQQELLKKRSGAALNWFLYQDIDADYVRQLLSTNLIETINKRGRTVRVWVVNGKHDHFWDCEVNALALSSAFGIGVVQVEKKEVPEMKARTAIADKSIW